MVATSVEGRIFGQTQERSSVDFEQGPQGSCIEETGPHSLQSVSEGEAKVSVTPSGGAPWRGVQRGARVACSSSEARRVKSGSSLKIKFIKPNSRLRRTEGKTSEPQPDEVPERASLWTLPTPWEAV
jgi:hypothetical protein